MLRLLYRNIRTEWSRTALGVVAVSAAIVLVLVLEGFKVGFWQQIRAYKEQLPVQLIAVPSGTTSTMQTRSALPPDVAEKIGSIPGVRQAYPLVSIPVIFSRGQKKAPITVLGYSSVGGPWRMKAGREIGESGEVVMDYALARKFSYALGDNATLFGREFRIVGLSAETSSMLGSYVFIGIDDAFSLLSGSQTTQMSPGKGAPNLLLIETAPGVDTTMIRQVIEQAVPSVKVLTPKELANNDVSMVQGLMSSVMNLLVVIAYIVGILVIGLTLYASMMDRLREYGILKALGAENARLYGFVLGQAAVFAIAGFALGIIASVGVASLLSWLLPQYMVIIWDTQVLVRASVSSLIMALVASSLPIRQMADVDPAMVFRW